MARGRGSGFGIRTVSIALQDARIKQLFPGFRYARQNGAAVWRGTLQPRESSPRYRVVIEYRQGKVPKVRVTWPPLPPTTPHLYADRTLCLYWPSEWRWGRDQVIAETILPWAALWLYYYELWLDTGEWLGPSSHGPAPSELGNY